MKVALVADWLPTFGGAEHVLAEFHALWSASPLFTTIANPSRLATLSNVDIRVSSLQKWYRLLKRHEVLLPWMPRAMERMDLRDFDVILSSSHAIGKGIVPPSSAVHVCYCHTPMRYAWEMEEEYLRDFHIPQLLQGLIRNQLKKLRRFDLSTSKRTDVFIANSTTTQERIARVYGRESTVVHPPVDDRFLAPSLTSERSEAFLAVGRLVPYKRFDLLIEAANALGFPLVIAGRGSQEARLRKMAGPTVTFLGFVPDADLPALYMRAKALLFPPFEDAGVVPLEAQACGTPVIAFGKGGALDTVRDGVTGIFFSEQSVASLGEAIARFNSLRLDTSVIREHALQFSEERFRRSIEGIVLSAFAEMKKK